MFSLSIQSKVGKKLPWNAKVVCKGFHQIFHEGEREIAVRQSIEEQ